MTMKVSKRDISILLIALGIIGAFCVFQFYFRDALKKKQNYEEDTKNLEKRLAEYENVNESEVTKRMAATAADIEKLAARYPAAYRYEDIIMYLNKWQELPYDKPEDEIYNFPKYSITETEVEEVVSGVVNWNSTDRAAVEGTYMFSKATLAADYGVNSYKAFKEMINTIYRDAKPKTIHHITASMSAETGIIEGSIDIDFYNVQNGSNTYKATTITGVELGVESKNIFGPTNTPTPTPTPTEAPNKNQNNH